MHGILSLYSNNSSLFLQGCRTRSGLISHLSQNIFFLIILHSITNVSSNSLLNGNCVTSIKGAALVKHSYTTFVIQNMFACYYRCKEDRLCQSLNFYEKKNLCELNNRTRAVGPVNFISNTGAVYLDNPFRGKLNSPRLLKILR